MKTLTRTSTKLIGTLLACAACGSTVADEITLRRSVRMRHTDQTIRLGDIATLEGEYVAKYADLVVARFGDRASAMEITFDSIEKALDVAQANRARFDLSGGRVVVRPHASMNDHGTITACAPLKMDGTKGIPNVGEETSDLTNADQGENHVLVDPRSVAGEDTARGLIAIRTAAFWRDIDEPVRIRIQTDDRDLLEATNLRPKLETVGKSNDGTMAFEVKLEGSAPFRVKAAVEIKAMTPRLRRTTDRGTRIAHEDLETQFEWIPLTDHRRNMDGLGMIGGRLERSVKAGTLLLPEHFEPAVHRNDPIKVRSGGRGWVLELDCICLQDGRVGETIEVRSNTPDQKRKKTGRTMHVRVVDGMTAELID
ncbi:MAG TPA: hypothetical protein DCX60_07690 [Phycisphaerales bacterium]|nr:hypothetical protein [Phycisphaerales bacterium]